MPSWFSFNKIGNGWALYCNEFCTVLIWYKKCICWLTFTLQFHIELHSSSNCMCILTLEKALSVLVLPMVMHCCVLYTRRILGQLPVSCGMCANPTWTGIFVWSRPKYCKKYCRHFEIEKICCITVTLKIVNVFALVLGSRSYSNIIVPHSIK